MGNFPDLKELDLTGNFISDLSGLKGCSKLVKLELGCNRIKKIEGVFDNMKKL